ncbi:MAG TPA: TonB-dependent receptor, partial [Telmatospirillum sp.]|nr:TonB-dependent receptor [Telmatospirillum sp.]
LTLLGGPSQSSPLMPLDLMPSVVEAGSDPFGIQGRNINIRGKSNFHLSSTVEGLPIAAIVGGADLFDLEDVGQEDLYRGGLQAGQGLGISNATGAIDQRLLAPQDKLGVFGDQSFGSFNFRKTFGRVDSGALPASGTRAFLSGSTTAADKWKGAGDESRDNFMLGVSQTLGERVTVDFDAVYNNFKGNAFRSLSYAQTQDLRNNYNYEYATSLKTAAGAVDATYYKFNWAQAEDFATLGKVDVELTEGQHLVLKPYFWNNNGVSWSGSGTGSSATVTKWTQRNTNYGGVLEYDAHFGTATDVTAGYWLQSMEPPPPPTDQRKYTIAADGGLVYSGWSTLAKIDNFIVNSPFTQLTQTFGQTVVSGGVRYMDLGAPKMQYYKTTGLPNVSIDDIWAYNPTPDSNATVSAKNYGEALPNIGVRRDLNSAWSVSASYGRKFGRPDWGPQASNFISNESTFLAKGITLQSLVDRVKPELSDQIDISTRYDHGGLSVVPTAFFAKNQNKQIQVYDPSLAGVSYYQGTGKSTAYGLELEAGYQIDESWTLFGTGTLASETYDGNTPDLNGGLTIATKGMQVPNAPTAMLKGGVTYRWGDLSVTPIVRYIGERYGTSVQTQSAKAYTILDVNAGYNFGRNVGIETLSAGVSLLNLLNRHYVSQITPSDTTTNPTTGAATYSVGAPRTIVGTLSLKF